MRSDRLRSLLLPWSTLAIALILLVSLASPASAYKVASLASAHAGTVTASKTAPAVGETITVTADIKPKPRHYRFWWGDGTNQPFSRASTAQKAYADAGTYRITVDVYSGGITYRGVASMVVTVLDSTPVPAESGLIIDRTQLMSMPTSGAAWTAMLKTADGDLGTPDLVDQDNRNAGQTMAAALVAARTGKASYRTKVIAELAVVPTLTLTNARVLSVGRQVAGYAIAADLVGYRDPAFVTFMKDIRTRNIGGHSRWYSISQTSEDTPSNWGTNALASRIAASLYVGDTADVTRAATVFRGFTGDRAAFTYRVPTTLDLSWACNSAAPVPINPAGCGDRDGSLVWDITRSVDSYPTIDSTGRMYSWGALGGALVSAKLLSRAGYPGVYQWQDRALLRAVQFLHGHEGFPVAYSDAAHTPIGFNKAYGENLGPVGAAGVGRMYCCTDWLP